MFAVGVCLVLFVLFLHVVRMLSHLFVVMFLVSGVVYNLNSCFSWIELNLRFDGRVGIHMIDLILVILIIILSAPV